MDEEDLEELRSSKEVKTNQRFAAGETGGDGQPGQRNYDPFAHLGQMGSKLGAPTSQPSASSSSTTTLGGRADAAFQDLVKPSTSRAGEKILQKMGWRPGQGIGPRITRKRRQQQAQELGVSLPEGDEDDDTVEADKHLYAPLDRPLVLFQARTGLSGLGHVKDPSLRSEQLKGKSSRPDGSYGGGVEVDGRKMPKGASFGLGALNDAEMDDEDVYAPAATGFTNDPRASRLLIDDSDDSFPALTPFSRPRPPPASSSNPPAGFFSDGKPMIKGFQLAKAKRKEEVWYKAEEPPKGWEPDPRGMWERVKLAQIGAMKTPGAQGPTAGKEQNLDADQVRRLVRKNPVERADVASHIAREDTRGRTDQSATSFGLRLPLRQRQSPSRSHQSLRWQAPSNRHCRTGRTDRRTVDPLSRRFGRPFSPPRFHALRLRPRPSIPLPSLPPIPIPLPPVRRRLRSETGQRSEDGTGQ